MNKFEENQWLLPNNPKVLSNSNGSARTATAATQGRRRPVRVAARHSRRMWSFSRQPRRGSGHSKALGRRPADLWRPVFRPARRPWEPRTPVEPVRLKLLPLFHVALVGACRRSSGFGDDGSTQPPDVPIPSWTRDCPVPKGRPFTRRRACRLRRGHPLGNNLLHSGLAWDAPAGHHGIVHEHGRRHDDPRLRRGGVGACKPYLHLAGVLRSDLPADFLGALALGAALGCHAQL